MQNGQIAEFDDDWDDMMKEKHGNDWSRRMHDDDAAGEAIERDVKQGWNDNKFIVHGLPGMKPVGKWPHPKSEYGKIAAQIAKADDAGELEKVFGKARGIDPDNSKGTETFLKWQKGELDSVQAGKYNRKLDEGKFSKKLLKIINEEILSVLGSYQKS